MFFLNFLVFKINILPFSISDSDYSSVGKHEYVVRIWTNMKTTALTCGVENFFFEYVGADWLSLFEICGLFYFKNLNFLYNLLVGNFSGSAWRLWV